MVSSSAEKMGSASRFDLAKESLQSQLEYLMTHDEVNHAIVAIESVDSSFRWVGTSGDARPGGEPMQGDSPFWIASVTKLYIASAILKLCEQELVAFEEAISAYLSEPLIAGLHRVDGTDYTNSITVQHLLGHMSGLPDYLEDHPKDQPSLLERIAAGEDQAWTLADALDIVRERLAPHFPPQPLDAKRPKIRYSDTNYQLLIAIIETVTGKQLDAVFAEMFYEPLGLDSTFHPGTEAAHAFEPATVWAGDRPLDSPMAMRSFRDLDSTVGDMIQFMRALIQGDIFDNPDTVSLMMRNWNRFGFSLNLTSLAWPIEYGLGMMRYRLPRILTPIQPLPGVVGHSGASGSWLFYCPDFDLLFSGTVDQLSKPEIPFRFLPRLLRTLDRARR